MGLGREKECFSVVFSDIVSFVVQKKKGSKLLDPLYFFGGGNRI